MKLRFWLTRMRYKYAGATLTSIVKSVDAGYVSEEAFFEDGLFVGYWAYGSYDPSQVYVGQPKVRVIQC